MGLHHLSKDQVSRLCRGLDEQVRVFRERPLEGAYPYLWVDAKVERVREPGGVRHKALVIAYGVHETGRREVIGLDVGEAETESFWREFLRSLRARGLDGVRLCISDAHAGLKAAIAKVLGCPWQRCTVHFLRDMLGHVTRTQQPLVSGAIRGIFTATTHTEARQRLGQVLEQLRPPRPKVARRLEDAEADLLAFSGFPAEHWPKLRSTNPLERVNREIGRRSDVVGIFPNDAALLRLAGMLLLEQHDEWLVGRRYLSETSLAWSSPPTIRIRPPRPAPRRWPSSPRPEQTAHADDHQLHHETRLDCVVGSVRAGSVPQRSSAGIRCHQRSTTVQSDRWGHGLPTQAAGMM